jgi:hypothetical protein
VSGFEQAYQDDAEHDVLTRAAYALFKAAGRPDTMWDTLSEHEKDGWRHCAQVVVNIHKEESP